MMFRAIFVAAIGSAALAGVVVSAQATTKTTNDGVYTAAQAARGKTVFEAKCTGCHEPSRFQGETFYESWNGKPMKELWDVASGTMPEDNPGSLKQQEYADILAYMLSINEFKPGEAELQGNASAMAAIKVEKKK